MLGIPSWRMVAGIIFAVLLAGSHWKAYHLGKSEIRAQWAEEKVEQSRLSIRLTNEAAKTTAELQAQADTARRTKNAQIHDLDTRLADALDQLRNRPDRPSESNLPTDTGTGPSPGCTGAQLYRQDATAFIGESRRAQLVLIDLAQCQAAHAAARKAVNGD